MPKDFIQGCRSSSIKALFTRRPFSMQNFYGSLIYTTAGTHPIQKHNSHGSRFPCQKVYIHSYRASSKKVLYTWQPFLIPKGLYTWLSCMKYKSAIYKAAVFHAKRFYSGLSFIQYKSLIYTVAVFHAKLLW